MNFKKIFIGTALSLFISLVFMCLLAVVVYFANIQDRTVSAVILVLTAASVFLGAFLLARNIENGGLLNGVILAVAYFVVLLLISVFVNGSVSFSFGNFLRLFSCIAAGAAGGVFGINTSRSKDY